MDMRSSPSFRSALSVPDESSGPPTLSQDQRRELVTGASQLHVARNATKARVLLVEYLFLAAPQWHDFLPVYQNLNYEKVFNNRCHAHDDWYRC